MVFVDVEIYHVNEVKLNLGTVQASTVFRTGVRLFDWQVEEVWRATKTIIRKVQTSINSHLRRLLMIRWPGTISNADLWQRTHQLPAGDGTETVLCIRCFLRGWMNCITGVRLAYISFDPGGIWLDCFDPST